MMRNVGSIFAACAAAAAVSLVVACERAPAEGEPVTLIISGDSISPFLRDTAGGSAVVDCGVVLQARAEGPEGESVSIREGGVQYYWWQTGVPIDLTEITAEDAQRMWADTVMQSGESRVADRFGFTQPDPADPIRAEVRFRYTMSTRSGEHETEPFRFYCF